MMFNAIASSTAGTPGVTSLPILTGGGPPSVVNPPVLTKTQKALLKATQHESTRQRLIQQLTRPASHLDELRIMPAAQLAQLSDTDLVNQALLIMTVTNPKGSIVLDDGTRVSIDQILREFSFNATSRGGNAIRAQMKNRRNALSAIALVGRYTSRYGSNQSKSGSVNESISDDDDFFSSSRSEALSAVGGTKTKHGARSKSAQSQSSKRTSQSTLAVATAGQQQVREQQKRPHVPTKHFGKFEFELDQQVTHTIATNNRDLMSDLIVQDPPSKKSRRTKEPTLGASSTTQSLLFPPGLLIDVQAATQGAVQSHAPPMVPVSNFLIDDIDDNFSDTNDAENDIMDSLLADAASKENPIVSVPIDPWR